MITKALNDLAKFGIKPTPIIKVGTRVRKTGGSYEANGTIVSVFQTLSEEYRCVFEFDEPKGMLHIFNTTQIVRLEDQTPRK